MARNTVNSRRLMAPIAAFTMAGILFVYSRSSIRAAKRNAELHRQADGGQISWAKEDLRRHGMIERPSDNQGIVGTVLGKTGKSDESK